MKLKSFKYFFLAAAILLYSCSRTFSRLPQEENKYGLSTEIDLKDVVHRQKIEDFYNDGNEGFFPGREDVPIYYRIYEQPSSEKAIMISSGRTEAAIKYKELIFDLFQNGYSVYIHDHRGQGLSGRMTEDPQMGYIENFQYYIDDMKYFHDAHVKPKDHEKTYLLTHSMGGAIGMTYLEQNPNDFDAAAFSSPMLGLKPPICSIAKVMDGDLPKYAMGESEYDDDKTTFEGNTLTGSELRYGRMIDAFAEVPKAQLGGVTYHWVHKSCQQFNYIFGNIDKIRTPFILFSAENEQIVYPYAHQKFVTAAKESGKECEAYEVENAQHELLIEKDEQRIATINKTLDFYSKY
jgi:lysophospholipase